MIKLRTSNTIVHQKQHYEKITKTIPKCVNKIEADVFTNAHIIFAPQGFINSLLRTFLMKRTGDKSAKENMMVKYARRGVIRVAEMRQS